ncbi:MAG: hypothetical protein ISS82_00160 [Nanoarchaeota archaeon]|nr:hypothetical protein [Nanoarchaeota archaeon]
MIETRRFPDKWLYFPILALASILLIKLIQFSKIIHYFPLHIMADSPDHISKIHFLAQYGFHGLVPNWYNGFILFQSYPPCYYYFSLPFYLLTNNILLTTYVSLILSFVLGFIGVFIFCKLQKISLVKTIAFFFFLFANPILIGYFAEIGRLAAVFTWLVVFVPFCTVIFWYKDHKIDLKFILFIIFLSALILSHTFVLIPTTVLIISLFLIKNKYEKIIISLSTFFSLLITSFWWIPFLKISLSGDRIAGHLAAELLKLPSFISYNTLILLLFWVTLYFYLKDKHKSKEILFFLPLLIFSILFFSRLIVFVPLFNRMPAGPYNLFFLFLPIFLFFKTRFSIYPLIIKKLIFLGLALLAIGSIIVVIIQMSDFPIEYNEIEEEIISVFPQIQNKFTILVNEKEGFPSDVEALVAYASIYYNLSSPHGHYGPAARKEVSNTLDELDEHFKMKDCGAILLDLKKLYVKEVISIDKHCDFLSSCNLKQEIKKQHVCLFSLSD